MQALNRWMVLGAVAVAMSVTGCREQNRDGQGTTTTPGMQEGTGGSGQGGYQVPSEDNRRTTGGSEDMGGTGGAGQEIQGTDAGTGGSGMMDDGGTGGSGAMDDGTMDTGTHSPDGQQ